MTARHKIAAAFCAIGACAAFTHAPTAPHSLTVIVAGDTLGYLSPCGCTEPMTGGILRQGTLIRKIQRDGPSVLLYTGGLVKDDGPESVFKAQALASALGSWRVAAANLTAFDAKLGSGELFSNLARLTGGRIVSSSLRPSSTNALLPYGETNGLLIGGASSSPTVLASRLDESPIPLESAIGSIMARAKTRGEAPVLLLDGDRNAALAVAKRHPMFKLITYRSTGRPPIRVEKVGPVILATPGERGQYLVTLTFAPGRAPIYQARSLEPSVADDASTVSIYRTYLRRVATAKLWENAPRIAGPDFAGSESCARCHHAAHDAWVKSAHSHAFATLAHQGHGLDPECLPCHVVGAAFRTGFQSNETTPALASVGCESCHGSGVAHVGDPARYPLGKAGTESCIHCHEPLNSPNFDFPLYWAQIRHGR